MAVTVPALPRIGGNALVVLLGFWLLSGIVATGPTAALARAPEGQCDQSARKAARETGVPVDVMLAVTRVETGRLRQGAHAPWPWTVNSAGKGYWFDNRQSAERFAQSQLRAGHRSFDVGCFQINFKWHGDAFASIQRMFDPDLNAAYAARFLKKLHVEFGDWPSAVGAYHSRTAAHAERYATRYRKILAEVQASPGRKDAAPREGRPQARRAAALPAPARTLIDFGASRSAGVNLGSAMPRGSLD